MRRIFTILSVMLLSAVSAGTIAVAATADPVSLEQERIDWRPGHQAVSRAGGTDGQQPGVRIVFHIFHNRSIDKISDRIVRIRSR